MTHMTKIETLLMLAAMFIFPPQALAVVPILDLTGGSADVAGSPSVIGWEFSVSSSITIDGLGFWDEDFDGLLVSHEVGLWNEDGTILLASATVDNSESPTASSSPDGFWRFRSISALALNPGNYVVAATVSNFDLIRNDLLLAAPITTIPEVTYVESRFLGSASLQFPPSPIGIDSFGPNLRIGVAPTIPGLGFIGVGALTALLGTVGAARVLSLRSL